jgi:hypothetical protein
MPLTTKQEYDSGIISKTKCIGRCVRWPDELVVLRTGFPTLAEELLQICEAVHGGLYPSFAADDFSDGSTEFSDDRDEPDEWTHLDIDTFDAAF